MPVRVLFGRDSHTATPHRVGRPLDEVLLEEDAQRCARHMQPLLTVDLGAIRPDWRGAAHFIHAPLLYAGAPLTFQRVGEHYRYLGELTGGWDGEDDWPATEWAAPFVELHAVDVPRRDEPYEAPDECSSDPVEAYWQALDATAGRVDPYLNVDFFFGYEPHWTNRGEWPSDPSGVPMDFVGQVRADLLTEQAPPFQYYLFYSPAHALFVQLASID
jgi:hypothetical protein